MSVAVIEVIESETAEIDIKDVLCEWMQECIDEGNDETTAGKEVLKRLRAEGLLEQALTRWGPQWIAETWHRYGVAPGRRGMWVVKRGPKPTGPPGARRVDLSLLRDEEDSVLETLWLVDGDWVRLGDMMKHQLRTLADKYVQLTANSQRKSDFFDKLATDIPKEKSVRAVFSEEQLRALLVELGA